MNDMHIIEAFDNGTATTFVEAALFRLDPITMQDNYEVDTLSLTQDLVELNERKVFLEGVAAYLGKDITASADELLAEVKKRYAEKRNRTH